MNFKKTKIMINEYIQKDVVIMIENEIIEHVNNNVDLGQQVLLSCLPTPLIHVCGRSPIIPLLVHQPAYLSIWPAVPSLQRGLSTNPGVTVWCICG